jgi:hypothetical protein
VATRRSTPTAPAEPLQAQATRDTETNPTDETSADADVAAALLAEQQDLGRGAVEVVVDEPKRLHVVLEPCETLIVSTTTDLPACLATWLELGQRAFRKSHADFTNLRSFMAECEALIIIDVWLAHDQNITWTANALGTSRKHVRPFVTAWRSIHGIET